MINRKQIMLLPLPFILGGIMVPLDRSLAQSGSLYSNPRPVSYNQVSMQQPRVANSLGIEGPNASPPLGVGQNGWAPMQQGPNNASSAQMPPGAVLPPAYQHPVQQPNPLEAASWTFVPPSAARNLRVHDIISIRVSETAQSNAQGTAQSRKNLTYDARLSDWMKLVGFDTLKPAEQKDGDARIGGQENEVYRSSSNLQTREEITFNIAAEISDIRPNGNIVISAHKNIKLNDNDWEVALSGICRPQDVGPDNVVLSKDIIDLSVVKAERGHVRDGYSRGWFTKWFARFKAF